MAKEPGSLRHLALTVAGFLVVLALAAGCHFIGRQLAGPPVGSGISGGPAGPGPVGLSARGTLVLVIHWPERDYPGFRAALIPTSTNAVALTVKTADGSVLIEKVIQRQATEATVSVEVELDAASNLSVLLRAYRESAPDLAKGTPIAVGTAAGVNIVPSKVTSMAITLAPAFVPTITAMSLNAGAVGDTITLTGTSFGIIGQATPSVTFNGDGASVSAAVTPVDATKLGVVVPAGATVGRLVVTSDGVPSVSNAVFWVASALSISAPKAAWDSSAADKRIVLTSTTLQITPTPTWVLSTGTLGSAYGQAPYPAWDLADAAAGQISASGLYTAAGSYKESRLSGKLGSIDSNALTLSAQDVTVSISPATGSLGPAGAASIKFKAINTFTDGSTNSLVTYSSADASKVAINSIGTAVQGTTAAGTFGVVTITATLKNDNRRSAAAAAMLTNTLVSTLGAAGTWGASAEFNHPYGVAVDVTGNIYVADLDNHLIRKVAPDGSVSTLAGSGVSGFSDGAALTAQFSGPTSVAVDGAGTVYVADGSNARIRKVTPDGTVSTLAGTGQRGSADGAGTVATFNVPVGVAVDGAGTVYVADRYNNRIRKVSPEGTVSTLAGSGEPDFADGAGAVAGFSDPFDVAVDGAGNVYVADALNNRIRKITPDGIVSTLAGSGTLGYADGAGSTAQFSNPYGVAVGVGNTILVAEPSRIRKVAPDGTVSTLAGSGTAGFGDGTSAAARFKSAKDVTVDGAGIVYVADSGNHRVRRIALDGTVSSFAGTGEPGSSDGTGTIARIDGPTGLGFGDSGVIFVIEKNKHRILKVATNGTATVFAGSSEQGFLDGAGSAAKFSTPSGLAIDGSGNVYVADSGNHRIRKVTPDGTVSTLAGAGAAGYLDGQGTGAVFSYPVGIAVDATGRIYVADNDNHRIRVIAADGTVTTLAGSGQGYVDAVGAGAQFNYPNAVAVDAAGVVYIADNSNHRIRKVLPDGTVSTVAGSGQGFADGPAASAKFDYPNGVAVDASGRIYVSDNSNHRIRMIARDGTVTTLAGSDAGLADGMSASAKLRYPGGVALDAAGHIYISDTSNGALRKLTILP